MMNFGKPNETQRKKSRNLARSIASSEKWRAYGRKLSRRDNNINYFESDEDIKKASELKNWLDEFVITKNNATDKDDQDIEIKLTKMQTLILSTLVPDEILLMKKLKSSEPERFVGVLLMADVSGFTALSEKYNTAKAGTYRLTVTLNTYLGSLIEVIYSHGGDIIKFAGDAFLALWKTDKRSFLCHTIHNVIACALVIQHSYGSYETDVKINLRVKLAISAGNLIFTTIGSGIGMNYVITGLPVQEAKLAESLCSSGEVKLTPTAWGHCYSRNYDHVVDNDGHVTIGSILYDPHEKDVSKPFLGFGTMLRQINKTFTTLEDLPEFILESNENISNADLYKRNELLSLRKSILTGEKKNIGSEIRNFMIRPVLTQIDAHQPLEYLTEMRQVSVLFLTLKPKECPYPQLITIVNNTYEITCDIVYKSMGCVNKIILFDKDIMILVIFGLRGFKHESEAQAALKCAYSVKKSVSALDGVLNVSIGITTGQVYCGVIGHPLRREFTVIGSIVNKAARFMCCFRDKITCDEATYVKSKMSSNGFTLQPPTELKGIIRPGKIYEYTEEIRSKQLFDIPIIPPLLNRADEMTYYQNWIKDRNSSFRDFDGLLLFGESRIGKTRLIEWMQRYAKNINLKTCHLCLTSIHTATPYLALSQIINQILDLKEPIQCFQKEEKIVQVLENYSDDLCYLNHIIKVSFAYDEGFARNNKVKKHKTKKIFSELIKSLKEICVIFLDDLHNLDRFSWEFITLMLSNKKIFIILTFTSGKFDTTHSWFYNVFVNSNIRKIALEPLDNIWVPSIACQILDVTGVSIELCDALIKKCNGLPGLIETFILHLFSSGALEINKIPANETKAWEKVLHFPDPKLVMPVALNEENQTVLDQCKQENQSEDIAICLVTKIKELNADINVLNLDALIMIQLDTLTPYQQLLLKIASVIGNEVSRNLLENIMYENDVLRTAKAIKRLFAMRILSCANVKYERRNTCRESILSGVSCKGNFTCECVFDFDLDNDEGLPKYAFCKVMKFQNKSTRKTFYELLPMNQKKEFHSRIVNFLENNKQKCLECGGAMMIVDSTITLNIQIKPSNSYQRNNIISRESEEMEGMEPIRDFSSIASNMDKVNKYSKSEMYLKKYYPIDLREAKSEYSHIKNNKKYKSDYMLDKQTEFDYCHKLNVRGDLINILLGNQIFDNQIDISKFEVFRTLTKICKTKDWHDLGVIDSKDDLQENVVEKRSFHINIEKGVSQINFNKCICIELNIIIYDRLIFHATEAELKSKVIEFLIMYSYLNILSSNIDQAIPKLEEAECMCLNKTSNSYSVFNNKRYLGKIHSLKASAFLASKKYMAAKSEIEKALKIYHINLNKVSALFDVSSMVAALKFKRRKYLQQSTILKSDSVFCLNLATLLYSILGEENTTRIATLRALHLIQKIKCNVKDIFDVLSNVINLELNRKTLDSTKNIEKIAQNILNDLAQPIQSDELYVIGNYLLSVFHARTARAEIVPAIRAGFRALVLSHILYATTISVEIIPDLCYLLLARGRIKEAVGVVKLLLLIGQQNQSLDCEIWYNALCIDMILDAGFQLKSPGKISKFAQCIRRNADKTLASRRRLVVGLWTYSLRTSSERTSQRLEDEALTWVNPIYDDNSLRTTFSALRLAEGMLESLARKINHLRKVVDLMALRSLADKEIARLEKDVSSIKVANPRLLLLKANSLCLSGRHAAAANIFQQALEESRRMNNKLEESLIRATTSSTSVWSNNARVGNFFDWQCVPELTKENSWHQILYNINTINR